MTAQLPEQLLELVGGPANVQEFTHCFVRLRFRLHNNGVANQTAIKALPDVLMVLNQSGQLQVALKTELLTTYEQITALLTHNHSTQQVRNNRP